MSLAGEDDNENDEDVDDHENPDQSSIVKRLIVCMFRMTLLITVFLVLVNIFNTITTNIPKVSHYPYTVIHKFKSS